jgi:hypothetical protein
MTSDTAGIIDKLERDVAEMARTIALLRLNATPLNAGGAEAIVDWISSGEAAQMANVSQSRMTALCRANRISIRPSGFSHRMPGRWRISRSRLRSWITHNRYK